MLAFLMYLAPLATPVALGAFVVLVIAMPIAFVLAVTILVLEAWKHMLVRRMEARRRAQTCGDRDAGCPA